MDIRNNCSLCEVKNSEWASDDLGPVCAQEQVDVT